MPANDRTATGDAGKCRFAGTWCVYVLRCADGSLYTGSTNDLEARERRHNAGRGAKYTAARRPVQVVYWEPCTSRSAAQAREAEIKRWRRTRKEALVAGEHVFPRATSAGARRSR